MRLFSAALLLTLTFASAALCQTPAVNPGGVQNTAGNASSGAVAPGSLVSIFGSNLAGSMAFSDSAPLSTTVGAVSVTIAGYAAPIVSVGSNQINVQVPWETPTSDSAGPAAVVVTNNGTPAPPVNVTVAASAPSIYSVGGQAMALNADGTWAAPSNSIPGINSHPAKIGDPGGIVIFATGMGAVDSMIADGANSSDLTRNTLAAPTVTIGGMPAQVISSTLSPQFAGVNQINVVLAPGTPTGNNVSVQITVNGTITSNIASIAVSQ